MSRGAGAMKPGTNLVRVERGLQLPTAAEINREHELAEQNKENAVEHAVRCGQLLLSVKDRLEHGEFTSWIAAHCRFEQSTATRYMKAAKQIATGVAIYSLSDLFPSKSRRKRKEPKRKSSRKLAHPEGVKTGDFREVLVDIADDSLALILTDPPYSADSVSLYAALANFAAKKLTKGGSLIAYSGQHNLPEVLRVFAESGLRYWWTIAVTHSGGNQRMLGKFVMIGWKPLVWFVKGARGDDNFVRDVIKGDRPDKSKHEWAQGENEAAYLIGQLTKPGEIVCDPFAGSGIFGKASLRLKRQFIGAEIEHADAE